ncbi:uncharacterized protein LOC129770560 [Toxorhynchites rutilus septentrionalis]|uniref:uncharacterized protein LOC129770560 n=1 Tax=Toxorhynchites rutilus septentrionalis TaxID=329112 RepID=UPI00247AF733|nr:uncharacterized protein LOC129770560 [Toxorhynchites rutilus septentrionalis]
MDPIWQNIVTALEIQSDVADKWFTKLKAQYSQPSRHYHNEEQMMIKKAEHLLNGASVCLQLAALFQYYHFDAGKDCVKENCDALREFFADANLDNKALLDNVLRLLGDVGIESSDLPEEDVLYFQDLDLFILGCPPEDYKVYRELLRKEYSTVETGSYNKMRLKVLQVFNRIPFIYSTKEFNDRYENTAKINIESEIKDLES